jgi:hypothetical protein
LLLLLLLLQENKIDYSARDKNPLDAVHFFDSLQATEKRKLRPDQISSMVVASYQVGPGWEGRRPRGRGEVWCMPLPRSSLWAVGSAALCCASW